jgi:catechol-2,3-dioxygenase
MKSQALTYGLTHAAFKVRDLARTKQFYVNIFDMEVMYDERDFVQLTTKGANDIIVFERAKAVNANTGGLLHLGFRLKTPKDMIEIRKRIAEAEAIVMDEGEFLPGSPYIFFKDPDGYILEVWYEVI